MLRYHSTDRNTYLNNDHHLPSISRTVRYKKFTKPLLERKRRARMNRCLDELKLLVGTLEAEGENINKLEKADILELTVRYLKRISRLQDPVQEAHRFHAGFSECASEACKFLCTLPGFNSAVSNRLVEHLKRCIAKPHTPQTDHVHATNLETSSLSITQRRTSMLPSVAVESEPRDYSRAHRRCDTPSKLKSSELHSFKSYSYNMTIARSEHSAKDDSHNSMWRPW